MLPPNDAWLLVFLALVLTAVFIRLSVTLVEMVRGRPTVLRLLAQCTMECGFSVHQKRRRVPSASCTGAKRKLLPNLQGRQRVAAHGVERASGFDTCCRALKASSASSYDDGPSHGGHGVEPS